ncbi:tigger transposable element-derived protein 6-like [Dermacentor albipictus]|uniref:tigger transposable element-derived protein 6-like n=1 Tax=Dermacentor albipictus TaxID=60249 RepID=UPI0038FC2F1D
MLPDKTLSVSGNPCHGGKHSKERVTIIVGSNMSGTEKLPLLAIGKSKSPRCVLRERSRCPCGMRPTQKHGSYSSSSTTTSAKSTGSSNLQNRKVLLFVDNCGAHGHIHDLQSVHLVFLPPNTTRVFQPMDQGIIKNLKVLYTARLLNPMVICIDAGKQDKRVPFVIGTSEKPRCFNEKRSMPVKHAANTKAWMTRDLFSNWLKDLDAEMCKKGGNISLLLENCSAHHFQDCALSNIELEYFPANCTSLIQ